jgi:hypothetical protein
VGIVGKVLGALLVFTAAIGFLFFIAAVAISSVS